MKIGKDKWKHFIACMVAALISTWFAIGLGIGKEYGDSKAKGNKWDWWDILADGIGALIGTGIRYLIKCIIM